jgi:outer membrane protein assembly factor BamB/tetratricopeptide (TPR) repeat protein
LKGNALENTSGILQKRLKNPQKLKKMSREGTIGLSRTVDALGRDRPGQPLIEIQDAVLARRVATKYFSCQHMRCSLKCLWRKSLQRDSDPVPQGSRWIIREIGSGSPAVGNLRFGTVVSEVLMVHSIALRLSFLLMTLVNVCAAQPRPPVEPGKEVQDSYRRPVFLPPDRQTLRMLSTAKVLSDQGRYSQAVRLLQKILGEESNLGRNEDSFISNNGNKRVEGDGSQSLKRAARRMLGSLPQAARDSYELQYGGRAEQMLDRAIVRGDIDFVAEVQRRYFHTRAGYRAMLLLAYDHLTQGNPHRAALCFEQVAHSPAAAEYEPELSLLYATALYRAGRTVEAEEILSALLVARKTVHWKVGDTVVSLPRAKQAWSDWLAQWAGNVLPLPLETDWVMFRGNATRTRSSSPSRPLMLRPLWQQRVAMDAQNEERIAKLATAHIDRAVAAIPAMQPLAVGETILMRTPERVVAVDFQSGKIVWQVETRPTEIGFSGVRSRDRGVGGNQILGVPRGAAAITTALNEQVWLDKTLGTMSSDGDRLFLLEEFNFSNELRYIDSQGRKRISPGSQYNVLRGRSVSKAEGKLLWSLGGPHDADPEMQKAFFLGPPLPLDGRLYQLAEVEDEVRLLVLDAATGKKLWQQQLAVIGQSAEYERRRRIGGISPSYAHGVLVCPTGVGALVAVDLTSRNLRWGYAYGEATTGVGRRRNPAWHQQMLSRSPRSEQIWADACAVIADGKVLVTPTESDQLHCMTLEEGELLWRRPRGKDVHLACLYKGNAILVGPDMLTAVAMDSGEVVDECPLPANGAVPSGRGYDAEGRYYLPVRLPEGGAVLTVDLDKMEIIELTGVRGGHVPGNLICHQDCVISQNSDRLQCFYQHRSLEAQIAKALEENAADPEALLRQGEILFDRGDATDAVQLFRRVATAFSQQAETFLGQGDPGRHGEALATSLYARGLLREGLLEALKDNFVAHANTIPEIESLIDSPIDQVEFLRVLATGQERAKKWDLALEAYLKLVKIVRDDDPLLALEMGRSARLSYLVRSKLDALRSQLSSTGREKLQTWIADEELALQASPVRESRDAFEEFFFFFATSSTAERLKRKWIAQFPADVPSLSVMHALQKMRESTSGDLARWATAEQAYRYDQLGLNAEAAACCSMLLSRWPNEVCWNEKTAHECVENLAAASRPAKTPLGWPTGKAVIKKQGTAGGRKNQTYQVPLPVKFFPSTASSSLAPRLWVEQRPRLRIYQVDEDGRELWSVFPDKAGTAQRRSSSIYPWMNCVRMQDHLLVLSVGGEVLAIDTLRARVPDADPMILWRTDVLPADPQLRNQLSQGFRRGSSKPRWFDGAPNQSQITNQISRVGPITDGGVTFIRNRELVSVDPLTGKENWVQKGMHPLSEVFGDSEHVFVLPPDSNKVEVYSSLDGTQEGTRSVPALENRWTTAGAQILCWRKADAPHAPHAPQSDNRQWALALYDPWTETDRWVHPVSESAKATLVDQDGVAVFEKTTGSFVILDRGDGEVLIEHMQKPDLGVQGIYVLSAKDTYFLITNRGAPYNKDTTKIQPIPQGVGNIFFTGQIIAIDRKSGESRWSRPIDVEQWGLSLSQPVGLPLLILARRVTRRPPGSRSISYVEMALIDKQSGREIIAKQKLPRSESYYRVLGDKDAEMVRILFRNHASDFAIVFSETPLDPDEPQDPAQLVHKTVPRSGLQSATQAVLESLGKAMKFASEAAQKMAEEKAQREQQQAEQKKAQAAPPQRQKEAQPEP